MKKRVSGRSTHASVAKVAKRTKQGVKKEHLAEYEQWTVRKFRNTPSFRAYAYAAAAYKQHAGKHLFAKWKLYCVCWWNEGLHMGIDYR